MKKVDLIRKVLNLKNRRSEQDTLSFLVFVGKTLLEMLKQTLKIELLF